MNILDLVYLNRAVLTEKDIAVIKSNFSSFEHSFMGKYDITVEELYRLFGKDYLEKQSVHELEYLLTKDSLNEEVFNEVHEELAKKGGFLRSKLTNYNISEVTRERINILIDLSS